MSENDDKLQRISQENKYPKRSDISIIDEYLSIEHLSNDNKDSYENHPSCERVEINSILHLTEIRHLKNEIKDLKERLASLECKLSKLLSTTEIIHSENTRQHIIKAKEPVDDITFVSNPSDNELQSENYDKSVGNIQNNENQITTEEKEQHKFKYKTEAYSFPETSIILKKLKQKYKRTKKFKAYESILVYFRMKNKPPVSIWRSFLDDLVLSSHLSSTTKQNRNKTVSTFYSFENK